MVGRHARHGARFRLLDAAGAGPATACEYASMLYIIKNAEAVNTGKAKPEELGVKALDR